MFLSIHRPADFRLPYVCVYVNTSCLAHTRTDIYVVLVMRMHRQAPLVESGAGGVVHAQLISSLRQPQESTDAPRKIYLYI